MTYNMKMQWFCLLLTVGLVNNQMFNLTEEVGNIKSHPCTDKNHLFLAPGVLTAGGMNRACVSRFYTNGTARMVLTLTTEEMKTITASRELPSDGGCLDINVPVLPNTKAELIVSIRYTEARCTWERRVPLRIASGRVVMLSTERARYRPGELVRLRVLALKQDLAPSHGVIDEVWLEGPRGAWEGSRVTQWQRVRSRLGLAQLQYQLDELAPPGKWTLRARLADGSQGSAAFLVGSYELPPFQLSVRHAPRILRTSDRLVWTVCVRYPWSEAVEGMLVIRLRGAGGGSGGIRTAVQLRAPKACHRHAAAAKRIGLDGADPPDVVVADFSFQEEGTRIWQNTTVVSQVVDSPISLEFLTKHRAVISPGLPYKLKVKATRWDDKPAVNERIRVCRYPASYPGNDAQAPVTSRDNMCAEGATDASGVARLLFAAGDDAAPFYRFEAHLSNDTTIAASPLTLPVRRTSTVHAALGPLKAESRQARTFVPLYLNTNITTSYTVHFVVITRGGIIYRWGATTQCPTLSSGDQIHTAPRNSKCNANYVQHDVIMAQRDTLANFDDVLQKYSHINNQSINKVPHEGPNLLEMDKITIETSRRQDILMAQKVPSSSNATGDISDALLDRHQLRVMLPIKVSHQMCPDSHLIAYFYHEGELISASKQFEMDECFMHKVEANWLTHQAQPGSTVSLQVSTPGPALCALTVLDTAAKWNEPLPTAREQLMGGLRRLIDSHRNLTEYDAAGVCFLNTDSPDIATSTLELTSSWLAAAGVRLLGGDASVAKHCNPRAPALLVTDEAPVPRSDFSEAWLWHLLAIGPNGTGVATSRAPDSITRFEAGAVCVSKNGVAVSNPAVLQVFREFFIHADSPKRLRRGDTTIIRYRIFNYLYEPLSVQIQILTDPHVEGPKDLVESACIGARASIARRAEIRARVAAPARIRIRAKAVSDGNCGNVTSGRTGVSDEVIIRIIVDPEGVPVREQKSILLCGKNNTEPGTSEVTWNWPPVKAVAGTETLTVWAVGDVTGPLLADSDSLLLIPRGCGEQNMAQLATNLLALQQLEPSSIAASTAKEHVARGFTRQLQYVHPSGGFSAFGSSDATSSTWLTAFVVRHMRRAHQLLWPNLQVPPAIIRAERWLLSQQMENGCFRNEGQVFHRELRGGLNDEGEIANVALTAYVTTSLIESSSTLPYRVIRNTLSCLRAFPPLKSKTPTRVYAQALLAYAYMTLEVYEEDLRTTNEASLVRRGIGALEQNEGERQVQELMKLAKKSGDFVWWEASSLSTSIEATAYALLALRSSRLRAGQVSGDAIAATRWLAAHRSISGGFVSTQDTLVALEALTAWSSSAAPAQLNVTARCSGLQHTLALHGDVKIPDVVKLRPGEKLSVSVEGTGCALIQATRAYNTLASDVTSAEKQLSVKVSVHTDGLFDCDVNNTTCYCAAVVEACVMWTGSFPEMALLEVTLPGGYGADAQLLYAQLNKPSTLLRRVELTPSSTRATLYLGARDGSRTRARAAHQCYSLHATGPRASTRPAYARLQDYYDPSVNDTQVYTIPEECLPRINHETNTYRSSDNLFTKARALDDDEVLITHEFTFEDIPEGIPLEDPIYENLTKKEKEKINQEDPQEDEGLEINTENHKVLANDVKNYTDNFRAGSISAYDERELDQSKFTNEGTGHSSLDDDFSTNSIPNETTEKYQNILDTFGSLQSYENTESYLDNVETAVIKATDDMEIDDPNVDNGADIKITKNENSQKDRVDVEKNTETTTVKKDSNLDHTAAENIIANEGTENDGSRMDSVLFSGANITANDNIEKEPIFSDTIGGPKIEFKFNESSENDQGNYFIDPNEIIIISEDEKLDVKDDKPIDIDIDDKRINDETRLDTRNNLLQEIDSLNKLAHKQLNKTSALFDAHNIEVHDMNTNDDKDLIIINENNQNPDNSVDSNYNNNEGLKSRDIDIKRSYKVEQNVTQSHLQEKINSKLNIDLTTENHKVVGNPSLADFHVIDSEKDLDVPPGVEGPIPSVVLPPANYIPPIGYTPPHVSSGDERRLRYNNKHMPQGSMFGGSLSEIIAPPNFYSPPNQRSISRKKNIPSDFDFHLDVGAPIPEGIVPPYDFGRPLYNAEFRRTRNFYSKYFPESLRQRPVATILPPSLPPDFVPVKQLGSIESVYTPNGPYFYFKTDDRGPDKRFFIPVK